jgi:Xaa-Pro aminopeptidase
MLDPDLCRQRQRHLQSVLHAQGIDAVVLGRPEHVYYFTGYRPFWLHEAAFMMRDDQSPSPPTWLVCGREPEVAPAATASGRRAS